MYSLFDNDADFARTPGSKDKQKRKRGLGFYAGAGIGTAALGGAGYRYGGAELSSRRAGGKLADMRSKAGLGGSMNSKQSTALAKQMRGGAKGQVMRDYAAVSGAAGRAKDAVMSGAKSARGYVSSNWKNPKKVGSDAMNAVKTGASKAQSYGRDAYSTASRTISKLPTSGKIGAGLTALGVVGGGGYMGYKALSKRKRK